ncbi:unnamed protein product [Strongylus vulgaris]|uniref:Uncharacterized protein n=1 Tax=Strongylus vulgaris TaxID=40348 RepID=A0A3P7IXI5_STRVU|nr:unnamed protein product [Strongylus vulgaris]
MDANQQQFLDHVAGNPAALQQQEKQLLVECLDSVFAKLRLSSYYTKLPTFSGEHGGKGLMRFLQQFNEIATIMGLTKHKMVRLIPAHLTGVAKAVYDNFTPQVKENWNAIVIKL